LVYGQAQNGRKKSWKHKNSIARCRSVARLPVGGLHFRLDPGRF
jgi:hypothetical protein